ncbi:acyl-CoA thioesterase, partial [Aspergillus homomorphus CBS 101889]
PTPRPTNTELMSASVLKSTMIMQPQDRNRHNFMIFGGFLLKQTFELAFSCAAAFSHARPNFVSLDPSTFDHSVPVGSILYLRATVAYTEPLERQPRDGGGGGGGGGTPYTKLRVRVDAQVRNVPHASRQQTGRFHYTFLVPKDVEVMPKDYGEFMVWTDARRRSENAAAAVSLGAEELSALRGLTDSVTE